MVNEVVGTVAMLFSECIGLFERVFSRLGAWGFYLSAFIIFMLYRFLLRPIMGAAVSAGASDTVKKIRSKNKDND